MKHNTLLSLIILLTLTFFMACHNHNQPTESQVYRRELVEDKTSMYASLLLDEQNADSLYGNGVIDTALMQRYIKLSLIFAKKYPEENTTPDMLLKAGCYCIVMATAAKNDWNIVDKAKQGIIIFDQLEKIYPDYENVKLCYLYRGEIYDNVLHDYDNAEIEYRNFILKYPNDSLTKSIRDYVDNILGKDLNDIAAKFEAKDRKKS
jgi:tetratricopeptide (TPR) repeat protein